MARGWYSGGALFVGVGATYSAVDAGAAGSLKTGVRAGSTGGAAASTVVGGVTGAAAALYTTLGFVLTMILMLFVLIYAIERRPLRVALAIAIPVPIVIYLVFEHALKTPLERGLLWWF